MPQGLCIWLHNYTTMPCALVDTILFLVEDCQNQTHKEVGSEA